MSLADTARLVASLELQDKFSKPAAAFDRAVGGMAAKTNTLGRIGSQVGRGLGTAANNLRTIGTVGVGLIAANVVAGIKSLADLEKVTAATNTVIKSTGGIAGITADKVRDLAEEYEGLNATMDDKVIQSAENLLLTFTNIREDAFEPALQAALDLNQAMGGGEEGLQGVIVQLGKALNDPIKGITALTRVGVTFTDKQKEQIRGLVEANDLYGAQQIILDELSTEFGGQFAAAGDTAAGKFAKLQDAIEGAQQSIAVAFLPVMEKVGDKLSTFLEDPAVMARIESFGQDLAGGLDKVIEIGGQLPWASIGSAFELAGKGAKAVLQAFTDMPPWVQTAVLTGWGLNKLTGGALGGVVGELAKGLVKGVLGINAGVVNVSGAVVNAPGGIPGGGGPADAFKGIPWWLVGPAALAGLGGAALGQEAAQRAPSPFGPVKVRSVEGEVAIREGVDRGVLAVKNSAAVVKGSIDPVLGELQTARAENAIKQGLVAEHITSMRDTMAAKLTALDTIDQNLDAANLKLGGILAKDPQIVNNITIPISTYVNASLIGQAIVRQQISSGYGSGPGGPPAP